MLELLTLFISASIVSLLTDWAKKYNVPPKIAVISCSIIFGAVWYVYTSFMPLPIQIEVQNFIAGTLAGAIAVYELLSKPPKIEGNK